MLPSLNKNVFPFFTFLFQQALNKLQMVVRNPENTLEKAAEALFLDHPRWVRRNLELIFMRLILSDEPFGNLGPKR